MENTYVEILISNSLLPTLTGCERGTRISQSQLLFWELLFEKKEICCEKDLKMTFDTGVPAVQSLAAP
jgi:hypothetical protein